MLVFDDVFDCLRYMTLPQLLLAFLACIGYALSQGRLLDTGGRRLAAGVAASSAVGFVVLSPDWMSASMLVAFAIAGIGIFVALAWLLSTWVGLSRGAAPAAEGTDDLEVAQAAPEGSTVARQRSRRGHAHSV